MIFHAFLEKKKEKSMYQIIQLRISWKLKKKQKTSVFSP